MSFSKLSVVKLIASGIVGIGTGKIVAGIIKTHVKPETLIDKVTITAAAFVIGSIAADRTKKHTNEMVDDAVENVTKVIEVFKTNEKLARVNRGESTIVQEGLDPTKFRKNTDTGKWEKAKVIESEDDVNDDEVATTAEDA